MVLKKRDPVEGRRQTRNAELSKPPDCTASAAAGDEISDLMISVEPTFSRQGSRGGYGHFNSNSRSADERLKASLFRGPRNSMLSPVKHVPSGEAVGALLKPSPRRSNRRGFFDVPLKKQCSMTQLSVKINTLLLAINPFWYSFSLRSTKRQSQRDAKTSPEASPKATLQAPSVSVVGGSAVRS
jgi:hypothetical protein